MSTPDELEDMGSTQEHRVTETFEGLTPDEKAAIDDTHAEASAVGKLQDSVPDYENRPVETASRHPVTGTPQWEIRDVPADADVQRGDVIEDISTPAGTEHTIIRPKDPSRRSDRN